MTIEDIKTLTGMKTPVLNAKDFLKGQTGLIDTLKANSNTILLDYISEGFLTENGIEVDDAMKELFINNTEFFSDEKNVILFKLALECMYLPRSIIDGFYNERLMKAIYAPHRQAWDSYALNQKNNSTIWQNAQITGPIYSQHSLTLAEMKMGAARAGQNGCGWVAAYNVMYLKNNTQNPADIIFHVEHNGGLVGGGKLGSNPEAYADYFNGFGMKTCVTYNLSGGVDSKVQNDGPFMLLYSSNKGAHYIAVERKNGEFRAYNTERSMGSGHFETIPSMDAWLKENDYKASAFIGF